MHIHIHTYIHTKKYKFKESKNSLINASTVQLAKLNCQLGN